MLKTLCNYMVGGLAAALVAFGAATTASAQTETPYATNVSQPANLSFNSAGVLFSGMFNGTQISSVPAGGGVGSTFIANVNSLYYAVIGPDNGLYVADGSNGQVIRYAPGSTTPDAIPYVTGISTGNLALAFDSTGRLLAVAPNSGGVYVAARGGGAATILPGSVGGTAIAVDASDRIYVLGNAGDVQRMSSTGAGLSAFSTGTETNSYAIAIDQAGRVYTMSYSSSNVRVTPAAGGVASVYFVSPSGRGITSMTVRNNVLYLGRYDNNSVVAVSLPAPPVVTPVPTLSEWAMILFGTVLAGGAALYIQRRRKLG